MLVPKRIVKDKTMNISNFSLMLCCLPALIAGGIVWGIMGIRQYDKAKRDNPFTHWRL